MTKISMKLFALFIALFAMQGMTAQEKVLFEESFGNSLGAFKSECTTGVDKEVWTWDVKELAALGDAYNLLDKTEAIECYLVSPEIQLTNDVQIATFDQKNLYFGDLSQIGFCIREINGTWTELPMPFCPEKGNNFENVGDIQIPAEFNGKAVEFGFKYSSPNKNKAGGWFVRNFVVRVAEGGQVEKVDPEISFSVGDVQAVLGDPFDAPVLNNPNNVAVTYSSNKPEVATVDPQTGAVTLVGEGFTTISATSVEDGKFYSSTVNYVLTVLGADASNVIFEESFATDFGSFYVDGFNGENDDIWTHAGTFAMADAYKKIDTETNFYLVSDKFALAEDNVVTFEYMAELFAPENIEKEVVFSIREVGGEWEDLVMPVCENTSTFISSGAIEIPAVYNGKTVQVAFKYTSNGGNSSGILKVKNLVIKKGVVKENAQIAFTETEVVHVLGTEFVGPELQNPNNLEVVYSSTDESVATVSPEGEVTVLALGETIIKANSKPTDKYKAGEAGFLLKVIEGDARVIVFEEHFDDQNLCSFRVEGDNGPENNPVWKWDGYYNTVRADAYGRVEGTYESYLVSPVMKLGYTNIITFDHITDFFTNFEDISLCIREEGSATWTQISETFAEAYNMTNVGEIAIPKSFNGKSVEFGFKYSPADLSVAGVWAIDNIIVKCETMEQKGEVFFEEYFDEENLCSFRVEGDNATEMNPVWKWDTGYKTVRADAFGRIDYENYESYLVSPAIEIGTNNTITFDYLTEFFVNLSDISVCVREAGSDKWTTIYDKFEGASSMTNVGDVAVPAEFDGKSVEFGFRYSTASADIAGVWAIDNIIVKGIKGGAAEKVDPELSFPEAEYTYLFGPDKFVAPVLNNPNNVEVLYSTDNLDVADVDPYTGEVWVYNYGTVVITASSEENDQFKAGSASYTLIVTDEIPTGIEGLTADDLKSGKIFDLQGRRVNTLSKGVYIVNGKKVVIK